MSGEAQPRPGYYYEHTNGTIHWKRFIVVDMGGGPHEYFDSPCVKRWWRVGRPSKRASPREVDE